MPEIVAFKCIGATSQHLSGGRPNSLQCSHTHTKATQPRVAGERPVSIGYEIHLVGKVSGDKCVGPPGSSPMAGLADSFSVGNYPPTSFPGTNTTRFNRMLTVLILFHVEGIETFILVLSLISSSSEPVAPCTTKTISISIYIDGVSSNITFPIL